MIDVNYNVTDDQLIAFGVSPRIIELSKQPFMRKGQVDFDIPYAMSIMDAFETVSLYALAINNPKKSVTFPPNHSRPMMGFVPAANSIDRV